MNNLDIELQELEKELQDKLKDHKILKPNKNWIPHKKFIKQQLEKKKYKALKNIDIKTLIEFENDLIKEQQNEIKQKFKQVNKTFKKLGLKELKINKSLFQNNPKIPLSIPKYFYEQKHNFKLKYKNEFLFKKRMGILFNYDAEHPINTNDQTVDKISYAVYKEYYKIIEKMKILYPQGFYIIPKLIFKAGETSKDIVSFTLNQDEKIEDLNKLLKQRIIDRFHNNISDFDALFTSCTYFVFPLSVKGGCHTCKKQVDKHKTKERTIKIISPKSSNNNCLFMCFVHFLNENGNNFNFAKVRNELKLGDGMIKIKDINKVSDYFKIGYVLINQKQEIIQYKDIINNEVKAHIMLMNDHYYIVENIDYNTCKECGIKYSLDKIHLCNKKRVSYYNNVITKKREYVATIDPTEKEKISNDTMIFFDLETFQETISHVPYACGYSFGDHKNVNVSYGKNCMNSFLNHILSVNNKIICAYNGSGFDFYILINYLKGKNVDITDLILSNGSVLSFKFTHNNKTNKVFDLYRFIMSSLDNACKAYKIINSKIKFDVLKIQSWELAEKYRHEVEPYLKYDVLSLSELFFTFNDSIFKSDSVNITKYVTLSHMAYALFQKTLDKLIEIPSLDKYEFMKRATYGARCYPNQRQFISKHYDDVINKKMTYEELIKTGEYIFNADATSLYPSSMRGFDLLKPQYPIGKSEWKENSKEQYEAGKIGFYEIIYTPPTDIIIPILPRKTALGGLEWSLYKGSGVFTSVEIKNAISSGYKVEFINKCLVYNESGEVFKEYITKYYQMKEDAERENNQVKRSIAKLLLNAMYGKTLQRAIYENTSVINNYNEMLDFFKTYNLKDIAVLSDSKLLFTGDIKEKETRITKPAQLGAFVLSYSREIMLNYMKVIDPSLKTHIFTYTDTDSLHVIGKYAEILKEKGYIKNKENSSLGYLCSDIDNEGVIINELNLAPKVYMYEYIQNDNKLCIKDNATKKAKGIPKKCLNYDMYHKYKEKEQVVEFSGLKRKHKNLTKSDINNKVDYFSIVNNTQTRTFMKNDWHGFNLIGNLYYPKGYLFK